MSSLQPRPTLVRRALGEAVTGSLRQYRLTLLLAPAGSGKSTLLGQLAANLADPSDTGLDPLIVDDFPASGSDQAAQLTLEIEARLAGGRHVLLASDHRLDDLFGLARLRGEVNEFGLEQFALELGEIEPFIGADLAHGFPRQARRALIERTEGWIGAWNVLRELLIKGASPTDLARSFSGRDRDLAGYFSREIAGRLEPGLIDFLCALAPLELLSEHYVRATTGRADAALMLKSAAAQCGFILPCDRTGDCFRLHRLFQDYLVGLAKERDSVRYTQAALRAAEHAAGRAEWLVAARLYAEAGRTDRTVELLGQYADDLIMGRGEVRSFRRLVGSLPELDGDGHSLSTEQALGSILAGDFRGAAAIMEQVSSEPVSDEDSRTRLDAIGICLDFGLERFAEVRRRAPNWLVAHDMAESRYRTMVAAALFWSCFVELDGSGAQHALEDARQAVGRSRSPFLDGWLTTMSAVSMYEHGQIAGAVRLLEDSVETGMIRNTVDLIRANLAYEQGRPDESRRLIEASLRLGARHTIIETAWFGWEVAARLRAQDEGQAAALQLLDETEALAMARHGERARRLVRLRRATFVLQAPGDGRHEEIGAELDEAFHDPATPRYCASFGEEVRLTMARYFALFGDPKRAISLVQPIQAAALRSHRLVRWGTASLIYAGALARLDEPQRAMRQAWDAIAQLAEAGYLMSIANEHILLMPLAELIEGRTGDQEEGTAMRRAWALLVQQAGRPALPASGGGYAYPGSFTALTGTERDVLSLAAQGHSNAEIAALLSVRVTTIKWHMKNLFAKLEVRSRTAAIAQARRLGIEV